MTEHDRGFSESRWTDYRAACAEASSDRVLVVPGMEYSDADNAVHILVWGPLPFLGAELPTAELLKHVKHLGGVAVMAHPTRRVAWKRFDPAWTAGLLGIELWNRKTDGWAPSKTAPDLLKQSGLLAFAGLDFHDHRQFFPLYMELEVEASVSEPTIVASFRARHCRALAFGEPAERFCSSSAGLAFGMAEQLRRRLAQIYKASKSPKPSPPIEAPRSQPPR